MSELLSYANILADIKKFKSSGSRYGHEFNIYDTPAHKYFKILFYFGSESEFGTNNSSGLLDPTWEYVKGQQNIKYHNYNSAWSYLKMNDENERAEKLEHFVTLLSDINTHSPWYFSSVGGISEALERKSAEEGKIEMSDKKLTITCLPDAFDNRITTLLDLYRDVTWSWIHKKEIIPANLRKFDMAIYIFETPEENWHYENSIVGEDDSFNLPVSYKMIEFHDCEFNYNSIKSGWSELNNQTGFAPSYTIDITYSDCFEASYNDIMMRKIGDVILTDLVNGTKNDNEYISQPQTNQYDDWELEEKTNPKTMAGTTNVEGQYRRLGNLQFRSFNDKQTDSMNVEYVTEYQPGFVQNAVGQVAGHLVGDIKSSINKKLLGNIYGFSLTRAIDQIGDVLSGNLVKSGMTVAQYIRSATNEIKDANNKVSSNNIYETVVPPIIYHENIGNMFNSSTVKNTLAKSGMTATQYIRSVNNGLKSKKKMPLDNIYETVVPPIIYHENIGNIFNSSTIANNI